MKVRRAALTCGLSNGVGFFGLGMALYFASQGAAFMAAVDWISPRRGCNRCWLAFSLTASLNWLFAVLALGLIVYGVALTTAITSGTWLVESELYLRAGNHDDERSNSLLGDRSFKQCSKSRAAYGAGIENKLS